MGSSAAAEGRLREIALRSVIGGLNRAEAISELEGLAVTWRGDQTEMETLQLLARLYTEESRFRDAFYTMRTAMLAHPNSEMARRIHDEAATTFDFLFLGDKGDGLSTIDTLGLFYDFRELTPIGRRGDEMIRRLADRLVDVDLLDQAAELLQYQIDHRLQGAARAQVATRLAVVYLMNRKADRALATLRATRSADFSNELRNQRLLIEARALSDMKRHDVALEVIANVPGREAIRLRADILWGAQRWAEAAEQIELLYGARWQEWPPLADTERADVLRAAIGFALGGDAIGLIRFREKYATKMSDGPDRRAFDVVTEPSAPARRNSATLRNPWPRSIRSKASCTPCAHASRMAEQQVEPRASSPAGRTRRRLYPPRCNRQRGKRNPLGVLIVGLRGAGAHLSWYCTKDSVYRPKGHYRSGLSGVRTSSGQLLGDWLDWCLRGRFNDRRAQHRVFHQRSWPAPEMERAATADPISGTSHTKPPANRPERSVNMAAIARIMLTVALTLLAGAAVAQDQLPSWNEGSSKNAIVESVARVTRQGGPNFVPPAERVAVFDNDGTLWCEQPMYVQLAFVLDRVKAMASLHPEWKDKQPFQAVLGQ